MSYRIYDKVAAINQVRMLLGLTKNGVFDEKIANIVKEKQSSYGLVPNGVVDYATFQLLLKEYKSRKTINEADNILYGNFNFPLSFANQGMHIKSLNSMLSEALQKYTVEFSFPKGAFYSRNTEKAVATLRKIFNMEHSLSVDEAFLVRLKKEIENKITY